MALVVIVAVLALLAGLAANRWLRPRLVNADDDEGMAVKDLVGPLLTMTVLLLSFVLVTANGSYGKAEVAARGEARALDQLVETAEYAPAAERARVQADAVCYARAVRVQEWPAMADGNGSPAPSVWSTDVRESFESVAGQPVFGMLVAADNRRSDEREERLTQATSSIPGTIFWFLLATLVVTVTALGICLPRRNNRGQIVTLVVITGLLTTALVIIRDVDRPFGGIIDIEPTAIAEVERQAQRDFTANHPNAALPCDRAGTRSRV
ncbi:MULTISPECIES: bestrophin-like domain [unclassified Streptomyces]|uniref:bestrophin-like domain n=1 Tax=unclassified Streptomyces TaxID=2593676 RepID=UPI0036774D33